MVGFQCLKCSAHFVKSEREVTCPDCGSTMVIEVMASSPHEKEVIEEPFAQDSQQLNATVKADTEESVNAGLPFQSVPKNAALVEEADKYLSRESSSATFKDDIGIRYEPRLIRAIFITITTIIAIVVISIVIFICICIATVIIFIGIVVMLRI